jgi:hypothetical protein
MTKKFCDCCGKEISGQSMPIEVPCHHNSLYGNVSASYEDSEGNRISGRYDRIDLCNKCSNKIFSSAMKEFYNLQLKASEKEITIGEPIPIIGSYSSEVETQFNQKKISDIISEIGSMSKDDYLKLHKEAVKRQAKMDKEFAILHEGASKEDDDFFVGAVETKKQYEED